MARTDVRGYHFLCHEMNPSAEKPGPAPLTRIAELLKTLYGEEAGRKTALEVRGLLARQAATVKARPGSDPLCQRDALLITYADQVREDGVAPLRTLAAFCEKHLAEVVSGIHLLPFYPWSSDDGFAVKDYSGVDPAYGSWEDIAAFRPRFDLMFDAVFNHLSAQGEWFQRFLRDEPPFRDFFITVEGQPDLSRVIRPRTSPLLTGFQGASGRKRVWTTFSADQVDLNFKNPAVLLAVLEALLGYVNRGARFIRLDAIAFLWKEIGTPCLHLPQTHAVVQLLRAALDAVASQVRLITETNVPQADNLSYFGDGGNEAQLVYNFALPPLVLHSLATGNAAKLTRWAQTLALPSERVTFFNFLASHDGIGLNPARGLLGEGEIAALVARAQAHGGFVSCKQNADGSPSPYELNVNFFDALSDPESGDSLDTQVGRFLVAHAIMLSLAGVPGIYFHSLFGSRGDRAGAEASGVPRRVNRQKLERRLLEDELADAGSLRARVFSGLRRLLEQRRRHAAFSPQAGQCVLDLDPRLFAVLRECTEGHAGVLCLHNVSRTEVEVKVDQAGFPPRRLAPFESAWIARS